MQSNNFNKWMNTIADKDKILKYVVSLHMISTLLKNVEKLGGNTIALEYMLAGLNSLLVQINLTQQVVEEQTIINGLEKEFKK